MNKSEKKKSLTHVGRKPVDTLVIWSVKGVLEKFKQTGTCVCGIQSR